MDDLSVPYFLRDDVRRRIFKRIDAFEEGYRQNIALIGHEGMGKTSFMSSLYHDFAVQRGVIPVYVHCESLGFEHLVERWMGAILWGLFSSQMTKPSPNLESLIEAAAPITPQTVSAIRSLRRMIRKERNAASIKELFALTGQLAAETGCRIIFLIDEFQELESLPTSDPFALFGKEIMVQTNTLYLISSSQPVKAREVFNDKLTLLFGNFESIELEKLGFNESLNFIGWHLQNYQFSEIQKDMILRLTDGHPLYLKLISDELNSRLRGEDEMTHIHSEQQHFVRDEQVIEAFHREIFDRRGRINLIFEKKMDRCSHLAKDTESFLRTLLAISHGRRKAQNIASAIERRVPDTKKILQRLIKEEIISKKGSFYHLNDSLFRFWLVEVFEKKSMRYEPRKQTIRDSLHHALRHQMDESRKLMETDYLKRIETLFSKFHNDHVEIDGKRIQCPLFDEVSYRKPVSAGSPLMAKSARFRWLCFIANEKVREEDVLLYQDEAKRFRKKAPKKILIALKGIDQTAKLLAQESKIQIWDLRMLNQLMDLYDLSKIVFFEPKMQKSIDWEIRPSQIYTA